MAPSPAHVAQGAANRCEGYSLRLSEGGAGATGLSRFTISRNGRAVASISDAQISNVECRDVTGDARPEVIVESYSGGAHCCSTLQIFQLQPSFRRILNYAAGSNGGFEVTRTADGRLGLVLGDDGLAYYDDLCFACSPTYMPLVACYESGRFVECTRRFPGLIHDAIRVSQDQLKEALASSHESRVLYLKGASLGIYAGHALLGRHADGIALVGRLVPDPAVRRWLAGQRDGVAKWIRSRPARLRP